MEDHDPKRLTFGFTIVILVKKRGDALRGVTFLLSLNYGMSRYFWLS